MTKVVVAKIAQKPPNGGSGSVTTRSIMHNGRRTTIQVLDANSPTLGVDLLLVFKRNVAKARRRNKKLFGVPDRVPSEV